MRLEVLVGSNDPIIFPLNKSRIILGSGEGSDIVIAGDGISRRHILITSEDDQYYVTDQGSTNGSFVNEEKLQPGKRVEFTSFFPVRLGNQTLLSLLSDEEDYGREASSPRIHIPIETNTSGQDSTRVISLKELKRAKTDDLIKKRDDVRTERRNRPKKKKKESFGLMWLGLIVLIGAIYFNFIKNQSEKSIATAAAPSPAIPAPVVEAVKTESQLIPENLLPSKDFVQELLTRAKCTIDTEIYLCKLAQAEASPFGAISIGLTNYLLVDATAYYQEAIKVLGERNSTPDAIRDVAAYIFLLRRMPELDLEVVKDSRIVIGLFKKNEDGNYGLDHIVAFKPKFYNQNRGSISTSPFRNGRSVIHNALFFTKSFYRVY